MRKGNLQELRYNNGINLLIGVEKTYIEDLIENAVVSTEREIDMSAVALENIKFLYT